MKSINITTAAKISAAIMVPFEMLYCMVCAILVTLPIYIFLNAAWWILNLFAEQQDEKPTADEIMKAEDEVLDKGGAFTNVQGSL